MKNFNRIMEKFWLIIAILSVPFAVFYVIQLGWQQGWFYLLFPITAFMMFGYRRFMRSRLDKWSEGGK